MLFFILAPKNIDLKGGKLPIRRSHRCLYAGVTGKTIRRSHRSMFESFAGQIFEKIEPKNYTPESQVKR